MEQLVDDAVGQQSGILTGYLALGLLVWTFGSKSQPPAELMVSAARARTTAEITLR